MATTTLKQQVADLTALAEKLTRENYVLRSECARANERIEAGHQLVRKLKAEHQGLLAEKQVVFVRPNTAPRPVVTRFYRSGQLIEKTRIGNVATERVVTQ